jgi:hypothetical protein
MSAKQKRRFTGGNPESGPPALTMKLTSARDSCEHKKELYFDYLHLE